jgi:hypothetical protein
VDFRTTNPTGLTIPSANLVPNGVGIEQHQKNYEGRKARPGYKASDFLHCKGPTWYASAMALHPHPTPGKHKYESVGMGGRACSTASRSRAEESALSECRKGNPGMQCCVTISGFDDDKSTGAVLLALKETNDTYERCMTTGTQK